jgi:hypothetical protein
MNPRLDIAEPQDSGLMSQLLLRQFADLLHMDIAIHHRELTGRVAQCHPANTIRQVRSQGKNTTLASYYESDANRGYVQQLYNEGYIFESLAYLMGIQTTTGLPVIRTQQTSSTKYRDFEGHLRRAPFLEAMIMPNAWTYENLGLATVVGINLTLPRPERDADWYVPPNICFFGTVNQSIIVTKEYLETVYDLGKLLTELHDGAFDIPVLSDNVSKRKLVRDWTIVH